MAKKVNSKKINSKKINSKKITNENEMLKFVKTIIIVTLVFGAFYVLTIFINKDELKEENGNNSNDNTVSIQYDEILIGNIFNQSDKNYYVLIEDVEDLQAKVYEAYLNVYSQKKDSLRVYTVVLNNMFNADYVSEESNLTNDITKFKVSGTTLLEISNGKIKKTYEKSEDILKVLKEISKEETEK